MKNIDLPSEKKFGIFFSFIFLILYFFIFKNFYIKNIFLVFSIVFFLVSFLQPSLLKIPNKIWFKFGILLGNIVSPVIMGIIFILVFFPISILVKLFKGDFMEVKINKKVNSYWKNRIDEKSSMKNQF